MAVIWFTAAALIGSYTLHHASRYGLTIVAATLSLSVLRIFLPLDLDHSIVIRSDQIYPFLQELIRTPLIGKCTVGVCLLICWAAGSCFFLSRLVRKLVAQKNFRGARMSVPLPAGLLREVSGERGIQRSHHPDRLALRDKRVPAGLLPSVYHPAPHVRRVQRG